MLTSVSPLLMLLISTVFRQVHLLFHFFKRFYLFIFRERGEEREREKHQRVVISCGPPTGDLTHNPGICPDWVLNFRPFSSQANFQSIELHQPWLYLSFLKRSHSHFHILIVSGSNLHIFIFIFECSYYLFIDFDIKLSLFLFYFF